jgi:voltage-gated potassium channel
LDSGDTQCTLAIGSQMENSRMVAMSRSGSPPPDNLKGQVAAALDDTGSRWWRLTNGLIFAVIAISVTATVLETVPTFEHRFRWEFDLAERVAVVFFTMELFLRLWAATSPVARFGARRHPRMAYLFSPSGLIDLLSVAPFYLGATNMLVLRSFRLLRVFRVLKLTRQARAMSLIGQAIRARRHELFSLGIIVGLALLISATIMYTAEHQAQPEHFGSIPQSLWWAVATLTTVGYGDLYPTTALGRVCASFIMILGIALVALPTGLLGSAMYELLQSKSCPHCGAKLTDPKFQVREAAAANTAMNKDDGSHPQ